MTLMASSIDSIPQADASLAAVLAALDTHDDKHLQIAYDGRMAQRGYHVTEVKAGSFVTLDCGANADSWQETVLQIEDIPALEGDRSMTVKKFRNILAQVDRKVGLEAEARLTIEIGVPGSAMQVFDVAGIDVDGDAVVLQLGPRPAICKPRHRAAQVALQASCCGSPTSAGCC